MIRTSVSNPKDPVSAILELHLRSISRWKIDRVCEFQLNCVQLETMSSSLTVIYQRHKVNFEKKATQRVGGWLSCSDKFCCRVYWNNYRFSVAAEGEMRRLISAWKGETEIVRFAMNHLVLTCLFRVQLSEISIVAVENVLLTIIIICGDAQRHWTITRQARTMNGQA